MTEHMEPASDTRTSLCLRACDSTLKAPTQISTGALKPRSKATIQFRTRLIALTPLKTGLEVKVRLLELSRRELHFPLL